MSKGLQFHERDEFDCLLADLPKWREALVLLVPQIVASGDDSRYRNLQGFLAMNFFITPPCEESLIAPSKDSKRA